MTIKDDIKDDIEYGSLPENVNSVNNYLEYMRKKSSYGGQVEICALSYVLNRNINVYKSDGDNYTTAGLGYTINPNNRDNDILLFHNMNEVSEEGGHHYDLLYPVERGLIVSKQQYNKLEDKPEKSKPNNKSKNKSLDSIISDSSSYKKSSHNSLPSNIYDSLSDSVISDTELSSHKKSSVKSMSNSTKSNYSLRSRTSSKSSNKSSTKNVKPVEPKKKKSCPLFQ